MPELTYEGEIYRLRAGAPMPVGGGDFVLHTFMAEKSRVIIYACTSNLPASSEFRGQGGNLVSANFSRLNIAGGTVFAGKTVESPEYVDEDSI